MGSQATSIDSKATWGKAWGHFCTITKHRAAVGKLCFKAGLYWQGLTHDLSKYSPVEFKTGMRFYQGDSSPNNEERKLYGFSEAWLHHKGRNRHHFEYWMDIAGKGDLTFTGKPMPTRYVVEMLCDRIAACKIYQGDAYTQESALKYYRQHVDYNAMMHPDSAALLERMLNWVAEMGEDAAMERIRTEIVKPRHTEGSCPRW